MGYFKGSWLMGWGGPGPVLARTAQKGPIFDLRTHGFGQMGQNGPKWTKMGYLGPRSSHPIGPKMNQIVGRLGPIGCEERGFGLFWGPGPRAGQDWSRTPFGPLWPEGPFWTSFIGVYRGFGLKRAPSTVLYSTGPGLVQGLGHGLGQYCTVLAQPDRAQ